MSHSLSGRRVSVQIDSSALVHNLAQVRSCCPDSRIFSVLKADAYGHGASECAAVLAAAGSDGFAVVFPGEAEALRDAGITSPILVLQGPASQDDVQLLAARDLWAVLHDVSQLQMLQVKLPAKVRLKLWIKIDTGMGRMGISPQQLPQVLNEVHAQAHLQCMGLLSHFACADEPGNRHTLAQIDTFTQLVTGDTAQWRAARAQQPLLSLANSAGVLAWPQAAYDWVRPGIMLYGANPLIKRRSGINLMPAMRVSAPLTALKFHGRGDGIGYSQSYICPEGMQVGYAAIGYGDGLPRALSGAQVLLQGHRVPIIGRVSMDSIALDLRGVEASVGDEVVIWGRDNPVEQLASVAGTISYELLCSIRGKRTYL